MIFSISIDDNGVLYSSTIIVWYSVQPVLLSITEVSFIHCGRYCIWGKDVQNWEFLLVDFPLDEYEVFFLITLDNFLLEIHFIG